MFQVFHHSSNESPSFLESYDAALSYIHERLCVQCKKDLIKGGCWVGSDAWEVFHTITDVLDTSCGAEWSIEEISGNSNDQLEIVGSEETTIYRFHYYGGPDDGVISNGFRPYFKTVSEQGHVYEVKDHHNYLEWVDDHTYNILLYYVGQDVAHQPSGRIKDLLKKLRKDNE